MGDCLIFLWLFGGVETTNEFFHKTFVHVVFLWFWNFKWVFFNCKNIVLWCSIKGNFKWFFIGRTSVVMGFLCRNEWFFCYKDNFFVVETLNNYYLFFVLYNFLIIFFITKIFFTNCFEFSFFKDFLFGLVY
jgi:hypothetical protein